MPRKYIRKYNVIRGLWTEENLKLAIEKVKNKEISKRMAQKIYGIPIRTLTRRLLTGNTSKTGLGPQATLGTENEARLAAYIKKFSAAGFAPDGNFIRTIAFEFAEKLGISHKFSKEKRKAGYQWLQSFLERNKDIVIKRAERHSVTKSESANSDEVNAFFKLMEEDLIIEEEDTSDDESENRLTNKPNPAKEYQILTDISGHLFHASGLNKTAPPLVPTTVSECLTSPTEKESSIKILFTDVPMLEPPISQVKNPQIEIVEVSEHLKHKKTINPALIKRGTKEHKVGCKASSSCHNTSLVSTEDKDDDNVCTECWDTYFITNCKKNIDWIKCSSCLQWHITTII